MQPAEILADKEKRDALVNRIQFGGDEVVKAKDGAGSATLSMAQGTSISIPVSARVPVGRCKPACAHHHRYTTQRLQYITDLF